MYEDLGFAKVDHDRTNRNKHTEVIFGLGKTPQQASKIFKALVDKSNTVICTRATHDIANAILKEVPKAQYFIDARLVIYEKVKPEFQGLIAVATGGTSDIPVAEEAALVLEAYGNKVERLYDVGVAGIHRLLSNTDVLKKANCIIAVAGMEGALPSVIGGLVSTPVIAVPTSIGYGANFGGIAALLAMLNSCAAGVAVVNIDNGFGAADIADKINKLAVKGQQV